MSAIIDAYLPFGLALNDMIAIMAGLAVLATFFALWQGLRADTAFERRLASIADRKQALRLSALATRRQRVQLTPASMIRELVTRLDLLRSHYDQSGRPREVIRVLEKVVALDPAGSGPLREEAGSRLAELDDLPAAMDHYAALLAMQPASTGTEEKLRQLAERGGHHDRYADGVAAADALRGCGAIHTATTSSRATPVAWYHQFHTPLCLRMKN